MTSWNFHHLDPVGHKWWERYHLENGVSRVGFVSTVSRRVKCEWGGCSGRWRDFFQCWRRPHLQGVMGLAWSGGGVARAREGPQPRSHARSPLVVTGHVTTQNLGGKKISSAGGVTECFVFWCDKLYGFQNFDQKLKTIRIDFRSQRKLGSRMDMEHKRFDS